jgi:deazaflavin-dependent oxidoreductase (nitroreductase family)
MPIPRIVAKANKVFANRVLIHLANRPPFAALRHVGRRSGRSYRIPINAFASGDRFVFALTYGPESDWVKNVIAAAGAVLEYAGDDIPLTDPQLVGTDEVRSSLPIVIRVALTILRVDHCLTLRRATNSSPPG